MNAAAVDTPSRRGHGAASSASEVLARLEEQYNVVLDKGTWDLGVV